MALSDEDKTWIANQIAAQLSPLHGEVLARIDKTEQLIEKTETSLLTEFHKWAAPVELWQRSHSAAMRAFDA